MKYINLKNTLPQDAEVRSSSLALSLKAAAYTEVLRRCLCPFHTRVVHLVGND